MALEQPVMSPLSHHLRFASHEFRLASLEYPTLGDLDLDRVPLLLKVQYLMTW